MRKTLHLFALLFCSVIGSAIALRAQTDAPADATTAPPSPAPGYQPLSDTQLDQLMGPIALYPDPLIAEILPACTLPTQLVLADRYVMNGGDTNQISQQPWDPSVQALAHYPAVLKWLDDNLAWTAAVGSAFLNQQSQVLDSIQRLRATAQNLGNLRPSPQQQVVDNSGQIEVTPTDPQIIYVPIYQPAVVYYQYAYVAPYVVYSFCGCSGWWLHCDFDWCHRHLICWNQYNPRPEHWWDVNCAQRSAYAASHAATWHPAYYTGVGAAHQGGQNYSGQAHHNAETPATTANGLLTTPSHNNSGYKQSPVGTHGTGQNYPPNIHSSSGYVFISSQPTTAQNSGTSYRYAGYYNYNNSQPVQMHAPIVLSGNGQAYAANDRPIWGNPRDGGQNIPQPTRQFGQPASRYNSQGAYDASGNAANNDQSVPMHAPMISGDAPAQPYSQGNGQSAQPEWGAQNQGENRYYQGGSGYNNGANQRGGQNQPNSARYEAPHNQSAPQSSSSYRASGSSPSSSTSSSGGSSSASSGGHH